MIIYENTIKGFIEDCSQNSGTIVIKIESEMRSKLGYSVSEKEKESWRSTLRKVSNYFNDLEHKNSQYVLLEYKVPSSKKRIDVIIVGNNNERKTILIIELKGWSKISLIENSYLLNIYTIYKKSLHPGLEALNYKRDLVNQYDYINKIFNVESVAFLPNFEFENKNPLEDIKYKSINENVTTYTSSTSNIFVDYLKSIFNKPISHDDLVKLDKLEYKPSQNFISHLKEEFKNIKLSSSQCLAFYSLKETFLKSFETKKHVVFISGAAGSGKTVIAFKLLGYIMSNHNKSVKLMLPGPEFRAAAKSQLKNNNLVEFIGGADMHAKHDVVIIDEAHKARSNITAGGFYQTLFKNANFIICLIDDFQVINKQGILREEIIQIAKKSNFTFEIFDLEEQFRNGGDSTYTEWLKNWIFKIDNGQDFFIQNYFSFEVLESEEFNSKYQSMYEEFNVRMLSFWTQTWNLDELDERGMPIKSVKIGNHRYAWNPNSEWLEKFQKNSPHTKISTQLRNLSLVKNFNLDKKGSEYIAYFNTVQGVEFDYVFVHIPKMFYWDKTTNNLKVNIGELEMREMSSQVWSLKGKSDSVKKEKENLNFHYFLNRLFVNLTRGTKGIFVYAEDINLSNHLKSHTVKPEK
ncbi:DUF2075 domain-containing protein [[Mycoplasma] mobile]|uniref:Putative ATPase/GTPase n=1 Tax=Mycoplasma mobile (strain ATCC 43663 / 163K / NCTC 11711) TaxID=267748 RepID=Q6KH31_MYCM1|nr:DUF2075 domain-containing protein [[Mycoplasma] mobile]AAT28100.1 putative ATPase/GTPase [Mycoplasma mobile 163K]